MKKAQQKIYWTVKVMRFGPGRKLGWELVDTFKTMEAADDWIRNWVAKGDFYGDYKVSAIEMIF